MARRKPNFSIGNRLAQVDARALTLLAPVSGGFGMNGPMRLVAMLLMLWEQDTTKGRVEWDHDQIADRTGLTVPQVADALAKLQSVHLVAETAAGPKLTWDKFASITIPAWRHAELVRPVRSSGSHSARITRTENAL